MPQDSSTRAEPRPAPQRRGRITSIEVLCVLLVLAILGQSLLQSAFDVPALRTGATVFVAVCVQALPFLVLGVLLSGAIAAFVPARVLRRVLPRSESAAVGVAGLSGVVLAGCECASVPVARRLIGQGVAPAAALTFLLAAPAVNPVVIVSTAVAFPGEPGMVLARFVASLATAMVMGWLWIRWGKLEWIAEQALRRLPEVEGRDRWRVFTETARADLVDAGGFLVLGALVSAALGVLVPGEWFGALADQIVLGILVMAVLAVVLSLCSEADAFVAASLSALPLLPRLVFLVVGPAVDAKLFALQAGTFGRSFALRFAPATFVVAICCAVVAGLLFLGGAR
ncbi:permease [Saccharomonospora sp. NPDC046836]|uniref:permease n=1 Tax=Saccharomonospora sp. NPDC046836 TaxID=3156921 RepID=UPI0033E57D89